MKIIKVHAGSLGEKIGVNPGDRLLKINNKRVQDQLDYKFRITSENVILDLEINGAFEKVEIEKDYDDDLGVEFEELKIRSCANDCVFCFVDQNPPNMRKGMYFRDGDYRMSYLHGHYITMTNMQQNDLMRIIEQRLSPLYISIHVTDPQLRKKLFLYKRDDKILDKLKLLTKNGIELHAQIVIMPDINDGKYLISTLSDIYKFYPKLKTCTIVPVGLTKYRKGLMNIKLVNIKYAKKTLKLLPDLRKAFKGNLSPFILLSDEWYILAGEPLPLLKEYGEVDLIENGVGQVRSFLNQFKIESQQFPKSLLRKKNITIATGTLAFNIFYKKVLPTLNKIKNLNVNLVSIINKFYGESVTVSGLLTAEDIISQLKSIDNLGDEVWMSHRILDNDGSKTLDDKTICEISQELNRPLKIGKDSLLNLIMGLYNG